MGSNGPDVLLTGASNVPSAMSGLYYFSHPDYDIEGCSPLLVTPWLFAKCGGSERRKPRQTGRGCTEPSEVLIEDRKAWSDVPC